MELGTLANLAEVFGALAVIVALVLGWIELRHYQRQRADVAAFELARSVQSADFLRAWRTVLSLPADVDAATIRERGAEDACLNLVVALETYGVMVQRGVLPLEIIDDLMGGSIRELWRRMEPWVRSVRAHQGDEFGEWGQWLMEKLERERPRSARRPAHLRPAPPGR